VLKRGNLQVEILRDCLLKLVYLGVHVIKSEPDLPRGGAGANKLMNRCYKFIFENKKSESEEMFRVKWRTLRAISLIFIVTFLTVTDLNCTINT
jgi:hypothetical protein